MARVTPSLTALLGLLAVAGYQNRDKISEMLNASSGNGKSAGAADGAPLSGLSGLLTGAASAGGIGGLLSTGLKDLVGRFSDTGHHEVANSWVGRDANKECSPEALRQALGAETITQLQAHTGLSESELISRLCRNLPEAVDKYTPDGRIA